MTERKALWIGVALSGLVGAGLGLAVVVGATGCAAGKLALQADGCHERGLAILRTGMTCESKREALTRLVREDPSCVAVFGPDAAAPVTCRSDGGEL
jgi:hypothetical protein